MKIYINDRITDLSDNIDTIGKLILSEKYPESGIAVALNDKIVRKPFWDVTKLEELDRVTVINAAFGG